MRKTLSFADGVKRAKQRIENYAEERLLTATIQYAGIFSLSNNARGWTENREDTGKLERDGAEKLADALIRDDNGKEEGGTTDGA